MNIFGLFCKSKSVPDVRNTEITPQNAAMLSRAARKKAHDDQVNVWYWQAIKDIHEAVKKGEKRCSTSYYLETGSFSPLTHCYDESVMREVTARLIKEGWDAELNRFTRKLEWGDKVTSYAVTVYFEREDNAEEAH